MLVSMQGIISPITAIKLLIEEVTHGDWVKYVEHVLSVERVYILVKGDRGRGRSWASDDWSCIGLRLQLILPLPERQRACEINCIWNLINYEIKCNMKKEFKWTRTQAHLYEKLKKSLTENRTRMNEKKYLCLIRLTLMFCCLPTELQRKLSKMVKVTYITMILYYVTPMIPLYNVFYLFPLSHAINSNRLIFDPSEVEIHQYYIGPYWPQTDQRSDEST